MIIGETFRRIVRDMGTYHYDYGHFMEASGTLTEKAHNIVFESSRYPMVLLELDIEESLDTFGADYDLNRITILLLQDTKNEYKAVQRSRVTFDAVLLPLYDSLISAMSNSPLIAWDGEHTRTLRYYWGSSVANKANDFIDAIQIELSGIKVNRFCNDAFVVSLSSKAGYATGLLILSVTKSGAAFTGLEIQDFLVTESNSPNTVSSYVDNGDGTYDIQFNTGFSSGNWLIFKIINNQGAESNYLTITI